MRLLVTVCLLGIGYFTYHALFSSATEPLAEAEIRQVLTSPSADGSRLKRSLRKILPRVKSFSLGTLEPGPHVVIIEGSSGEMELDDILDRLEELKGTEDLRGLDFARWAMFSAAHPPAEKESIFEQAMRMLPHDQAAMLARDVLTRGELPELYDRALAVRTQGLPPAQVEELVRELWAQAQSQELRDFLFQYAADKGLNPPE